MSTRLTFGIEPNKFPFYYGWVILVVCTMGVIMSVPGQTMGVSVFTNSIIEEYGISRELFSIIYLLGTSVSALFLPLAGMALDRWGARRMIVLATLGLSFSLLLIAYIKDALSFFFGQATPRLLLYFALFFGFLCLRHFGQGQLTTISRATLARWFDKRRGFAFSLSGAFVALGFGVAPLFLQTIKTASGSWKNAIAILVFAELAMLILGFLFYRTNPTQVGVQMEQGWQTNKNSSRKKEKAEEENARDWTRQEAIGSSVFWVFCAGMGIFALVNTAIIFHYEEICFQGKVDPTFGYSLFLPVGILSIFSEIVGSNLSDYISLRKVYLGMLVMFGIGIFGVANLGSLYGQVLMAIGLGISGGLFVTINSVTWPKLFGQKHLGAIMGVSSSCIVLGSAFGPYLLSLGNTFFQGFASGLLLSIFPVFALLIYAMFHRLETVEKTAID